MKWTLLIGTVLTSAALLGGCKDDTQTTGGQPPGTSQATRPAPTAGEHPHTDGDEHEGDDHPDRVELGTKTIGGLTLKAMQNEPVNPGGEGAFDLVITGGKPKAVRFWVGTEDGEGSVKAKAEEETPDNWHTHVEVPDPLPPGSKFWAEVEPTTGEPFTVSFDLK